MNKAIKDGQSCSHSGCLNHISHPCEGCGRINGVAKSNNPKPLTQEERKLIKEKLDSFSKLQDKFQMSWVMWSRAIATIDCHDNTANNLYFENHALRNLLAEQIKYKKEIEEYWNNCRQKISDLERENERLTRIVNDLTVYGSDDCENNNPDKLTSCGGRVTLFIEHTKCVSCRVGKSG